MSTTEERLAKLEASVFGETKIDPNAAVRAQWDAIPLEEKEAKWWGLNCRPKDRARWQELIPSTYEPLWLDKNEYRIVKTAAHPDNNRHARVKLEWDRVKDRGTHTLTETTLDGELISQRSNGVFFVEWRRDRNYEIRPIAEKKKLIDKSKLPIGTMTSRGKIVGIRGESFDVYDGVALRSLSAQSLRIVPMTEWEVLRDGDRIPEGVVFECSTFWPRNSVGFVFRITGLEEGYTDAESEVM